MRRVATGEKRSGEKRLEDIPKFRRWFLLILVSVGSSTIYAPAYLKGVFYDPLMDALDLNNTQLGALVSAYAITATICYLPAGILADKVRVRTLSTVGFIGTALLTFYYATLPSYGVLMFVFIGMGITSILIWWGVRFKLVRLVSTEEEYPKRIGLSYGFYGAAGLVVGMINLVIISAFKDEIKTGVTTLLIFLGVLIFILGVLSWIFIPKFEGEIGTGETTKISDSFAALRNPIVLISAATMFFVYFFYTGVTYTTPYLSNVLGASAELTGGMSVVRTYGITLLSGPIFGMLASKAKSPSKVIWIGSLIAAAGLVVLAFMPSTSAMIMVVAAISIGLGFISNGVFGIVSAQLTEGKVPLSIFGAATGMLSIVGFLPDTFSSTWFGAMIDSQGGAAYRGIFLILAGSAVLAGGAALGLRWYVGRKSVADQAEIEDVGAK